MSYENICFATEGSIALVTLNRPQRRNALSLALMQELIDCLEEIGSRRDLRAVILAAKGKVFSRDTTFRRWLAAMEAITRGCSTSARS